MTTRDLNRREFGKQVLGGIGGAFLAPAMAKAAGGGAAPRRPNIVYVLSDQHSYKYCGFMGHPIVRTPNLDRIARRGTVFRSTYCGSPLCAPSRAGMLSGCYPSDVNSFCNATTWDGSLPAWPALVRDAGYKTFGCGKLDTDPKFDLGFQEVAGLTNDHAHAPDITSFFRRPLCMRYEERAIVDGGSRANRHKFDLKQADATVEFIRKQAGSDVPFATYTGFHMPHPSFYGLESHYHYYLNRVDLPNVPPGDLDNLPFAFQELRNFKNIATPIPDEKIRRARAGYFAMITEMDEYAGRIYAAVEAAGQLDHTIFVYSSDHGDAMGDHGLWLKNNLFESADRVPLVMAGPGIPQGRTIETPVAHVDLIRTFLDWSGARSHDRLRGHSLAPMLRGEPGDHPGWAYSECHTEGMCTGMFMVRKGDWKYLHLVNDEGLLFNLADDPGEFHNRIRDPQAQPPLRELQAILHSTVDPDEVTLRGFDRQRKRFDRMAREQTPEQMMDQFRPRLGECQAATLLTAYYGKPFRYTHKAPGGPLNY